APHSRGPRVSTGAGKAAPARPRPGLGGERVRGADRAPIVPAATLQSTRRGRSAPRRSAGRPFRPPRRAPAGPLPARGQGLARRDGIGPPCHGLPSAPEPPRRLCRRRPAPGAVAAPAAGGLAAMLLLRVGVDTPTRLPQRPC